MLSVSNYHYIREDFSSPFPSIFGLTPKMFEKQLVLLKDLGTFIHPNDLVSHANEILKSDQHFILITFDDGLREQYDLAKPVLDNHKIPALFFVNSLNFIQKEVSLVHKIHLLRSQIASQDLLLRIKETDLSVNLELTNSEKENAIKHYNYDDVQSAYLKYLLNFKLTLQQQAGFINKFFHDLFNEKQINEELYMTEQNLIELSKEGLLGSHTHSHLALGLLEPLQIHKELELTKTYLEQLTNTTISTVSYPYGSSEACALPVPDIAKKMNYSIGFTMERGINKETENKLLLKRFDCNDLPGGKNEKSFIDEYSFIYK
jgi:peptidoglycan/xylan/chitin deacetylase (PgdA/CDA1 family)